MNQLRQDNGRFTTRGQLNRKRHGADIKKIENKKRKLMEESNVIETENESSVVKGWRIINVKEFAKNMKCSQCQELLDLEKISKEKRCGLNSTWIVICDKCKEKNSVKTGPGSKTNNETYYDVNAMAVLGAVHSGIGCTGLNKIFSCMDIPQVSTKTFKRYENLVGKAIEDEAKRSCKRAAEEEKRLVIENIEKVCEKL